MNITAIKLTTEELDQITKYLTQKFDAESDSKQLKEFNLSDVCSSLLDFETGLYNRVNIEAELILSIDYSERESDTNYSKMIWRSSTFKIIFFYDGEELEVNSDKIYNDIETYYSL